MGELVDIFPKLNDTAHENTQHGDFIFEANKISRLKINQICLLKLARIKAMLEGILVSMRGAAAAL